MAQKKDTNGIVHRPAQPFTEDRGGYQPHQKGYQPLSTTPSEQSPTSESSPPKPPVGGTGQSSSSNNTTSHSK